MQILFASEGNLGNNPTLKYVPVNNGTQQKAVVEFDVKFNSQKYDKRVEEYKDSGGFWGRVSLWGKRAEYLNKHLVKGCRVVVVGEYTQIPYVGTRGENEGKDLIANEINATFVGLSLMGVESIKFEKRVPREIENTTNTPDGNPNPSDFSDDLPC